MKRLILLPALIALYSAANAQGAQTFHTEFKIYQADHLQMGIRLWEDGTNFRREYDKKIPVTYITTKDGTYIIVNNNDRCMRLNNDAPMLKDKFVEKEAVWPMGDLDGFLKQYKAQPAGEAPSTLDGKKVTAIKYTYHLPDAAKTVATLFVDKTTNRPIRVVYGKNHNVGIPSSQLKKGDTVTFQTRIEYTKYSKGEAFSKDLFKAPATVVDAKNGEMFGTLSKGKRAGGS